ncbi:MAG: dihydrofolate reductase, partial [Prevotellaceae bacterium]|nr:dihydrofolate reductase [Prevotellaceae bacterium]
MRQFNKLVAIEPVSLTECGVDEVNKMAKEVILYDDIPSDDDEIVSRIDDADAVLLSYTSQLTANAMKRCPNIKYVGMCCSLYSPESANVDIRYAEQMG